MHRHQHQHGTHETERPAEHAATDDHAHLRVAGGAVPPVASAASTGGGHGQSASEHAYMHHHGGDRNVSMLSINRHHREKNGPGEQSTRVAWDGKDPELE